VLPETERMIFVLKTCMRIMEVTQQDLEKELHVAPGYIGRLFRGAVNLRFDHIVRIAEVIKFHPSELLRLAFGPATGAYREMIQNLGGPHRPPIPPQLPSIYDPPPPPPQQPAIDPEALDAEVRKRFGQIAFERLADRKKAG
jgi:transcriptional regulator with XRE-family HTH domain